MLGISKRIIYILILLFTTAYTSHGQQVKKEEIEIKLKFLKRKDYQNITSLLNLTSQLIEVHSHPKIQFEKQCNKLNECLMKDSIIITLISGVSWNIKQKPPHVPNKIILKYLFNRKKLTNEEWYLFNYLEYYYNSHLRKQFTEKYTRYVYYYKNNELTNRIIYEYRYDNDGDLKLTNKEFIDVIREKN